MLKFNGETQKIYNRFITKILQPFLKRQHKRKGRRKKQTTKLCLTQNTLIAVKLKYAGNINVATNAVYYDYAKMKGTPKIFY